MQSSRRDLKGAFTIHNDRFDNVDLTSDYLDVHFRLEHLDFGSIPEVYLYGALTGWDIDPNFKMEYREASGEFALDVVLKQGWYDYQYVSLDDAGGAFEGSHAGTPNRYHVYAHVPDADGTDRIIGFNALDAN